ncbi:hypothetical protein NP493_1193g01015 [Ridgeia piscesae]|uniref:Uncharacterized protein n=1 Tax=Ridgeia piscesae TaxID=27915 RepID=A0AAD9KDM7_RIDPI|nr:hypothetical protein NP493_1193g01015 [Ridgeia piscesae]
MTLQTHVALQTHKTLQTHNAVTVHKKLSRSRDTHFPTSRIKSTTVVHHKQTHTARLCFCNHIYSGFMFFSLKPHPKRWSTIILSLFTRNKYPESSTEAFSLASEQLTTRSHSS